MLIWAAGLSFFFVISIRGNATNDGLFLDQIINEFMQGDYSALNPGGYLSVYPFQIGYVMLGQLLYLLVGPSNYLAYQILNIVSILITLYCLDRITWELFHDDRICNVMDILSMGAVFLYVYATLIYNDIWSLAPQFAAIYLEMCYLNQRKIRHAVGSVLCIAFACLLKTNCYVALLAMVFTMILSSIRLLGHENVESDDIRKGKLILERIVIIVCMIFVTFLLSGVVKEAYKKKAGLEQFPSGTPSMAYFAMGLQETTDEGVVKNGWYNGYNANILAVNSYDTAKASEEAKRDLIVRLGELTENPKSLIKFMGVKFIQQWGDETCTSLREMEETARHVENPKSVAQWLTLGGGRTILRWVMNVYQSIIYLGMVCAIAIVFKRWLISKEEVNKNTTEKWRIEINLAFLVMFIFGGMLFHEIWEASGRYIIRYYLAMLPLAAYGLTGFMTTKLSKEVDS